MNGLLWLTAAFLLGGCAGAPVPRPGVDPAQVWQAHQAALARVQTWHINGRIAIQTEDEGWHAVLDWRQEQDHYDIHLTGPLGQGHVQLTGDDRQVLLRREAGEVADNDAEALLYQETGWRVPVRALRYWVLGLPAPDAGDVELDTQGYPARLHQDGWHIEWMEYSRQGDLMLPRRIFAHNHRARVRLVVDRWTL